MRIHLFTSDLTSALTSSSLSVVDPRRSPAVAAIPPPRFLHPATNPWQEDDDTSTELIGITPAVAAIPPPRFSHPATNPWQEDDDTSTEFAGSVRPRNLNSPSPFLELLPHDRHRYVSDSFNPHRTPDITLRFQG
jgi:hypothetical protein